MTEEVGLVAEPPDEHVVISSVGRTGAGRVDPGEHRGPVAPSGHST